MNRAANSQCIAASSAAWRLSEVCSTTYESARNYSKYASELLTFFAAHRTAAAGQVQRLLPDQFHTVRSVRMHLQTLSVARQLAVVRSPALGAVNVYVITPRGLRAVADGDESSANRLRPRSGSHLAHELLTTELAVRLRESSRLLSDLRIAWEERFGFHRYGCFRSVVPDLAFLVKRPSGQLTYFCEVSSGEDSTARLREKLLSYALWAEAEDSQQFLVDLYSENGAVQPRPHFRLLFVLHHRLGLGDEGRVRQLVQAANDVSPSLRRRIWFTTANELSVSRALHDSIWWQLRDFDDVYEDPAARRRMFNKCLAKAQQSARRHSLFAAEASP